MIDTSYLVIPQLAYKSTGLLCFAAEFVSCLGQSASLH